MLDAARAVIILIVAWLAFRVLFVCGSFICEHSGGGRLLDVLAHHHRLSRNLPPKESLSKPTLPVGGNPGGWLMAGAVVGFVYNHIASVAYC